MRTDLDFKESVGNTTMFLDCLEDYIDPIFVKEKKIIEIA